jgi:hypothetical protein
MFLAESTQSGFFFLAPWIVLAPVLGLLINSIFSHRFSEKLVGTIASAPSGVRRLGAKLFSFGKSW